jgi:hypothetical protein
VQVVTTAKAPELQRKDPPQERRKHCNNKINNYFPQNKRQKSKGAKQMVVFGTESGSSFVACQASDNSSKSHLSPASWEEAQTIYGAI